MAPVTGLCLSLAVLAGALLLPQPPQPLRADSATPEFVGSETAVKPLSNNPQLVVVATPAGAVGDLLIAILAIDRERTPVTPEGWTLIESGFTHQEEATLAIWYRLADGTEEQSYTLEWTGGKRPAVAAILRYRGAHTTDPIGPDRRMPPDETNEPEAPSVARPRGRVGSCSASTGWTVAT